MPPQLGYGYLAYAPFGDLRQLLRDFELNDPQIPEPFIWILFRGMAEALFTLYTGNTIAYNEPAELNAKIDPLRDPIWMSRLNLDIKPLNIVFSHPHDPWRAYKTPQMIDFGLVFNLEDVQVGFGTPGFMPPEQIRNSTRSNTGMSEATPIFNLGLVILSLMEQKEMGYLYDSKNPDHRIKPSNEYDGHYSSQLLLLALECLHLDKEKRPTLMDILYKTRKGLERWESIYGGIGDAELDQLPPFAQFRFDEEEFKVGERAPKQWIGKKRKTAVDSISSAAPDVAGSPPKRSKRGDLPATDKPVEREVLDEQAAIPPAARSTHQKEVRPKAVVQARGNSA
jgi:serine/threonine protein kinase